MIVDSSQKGQFQETFAWQGGFIKLKELTLLLPSSLHSLLDTQSSMTKEESLPSQSHRQGLARLTERAIFDVLFLAHLGRFEALRPRQGYVLAFRLSIPPLRQ